LWQVYRQWATVRGEGSGERGDVNEMPRAWERFGKMTGFDLRNALFGMKPLELLAGG